MKKVEYFTIVNHKNLLVVYSDGSTSVIDLCLLFGLEMQENKEEPNDWEEVLLWNVIQKKC